MSLKCKVGDWVKYQQTDNFYSIGIIIDYSLAWNKYLIDWKLTVNDGSYHIPEHLIQCLPYCLNSSMLIHKPTIQELFQIKQLEEIN